MDEADEAIPVVNEAEVGLNQLLGLFDVPAFARRGQDLEYALSRLNERVTREYSSKLEMVRLRLRQWASVAIGFDDGSDTFETPVGPLWALAGASAPAWAPHRAAQRRRRTVARDLVASVARFNSRWAAFLHNLPLDPLNNRIDQYNRYYVLEKECVLGSARLAARHFVVRPHVTVEGFLAAYPCLPVLKRVG